MVALLTVMLRAALSSDLNHREASRDVAAVESTWSSCLPFGKTVISWRYSASQGAIEDKASGTQRVARGATTLGRRSPR
jgi:hypothetical protein